MIFTVLSVALLYNVVQMQTKFVTWSDYCQESYVHRVEEFFTVLWLANLKRLGYNGRTAVTNFVLLVSAITIRKGIAIGQVYGNPGKNAEAIQLLCHMLFCFCNACLIKYRPEYFTLWTSCFALSELLVTSKFMTAPSLIIFASLYTALRETWHRMVFGRKATVEVTRFREAWVECSERNPNVVTELTKLSNEIIVHLDQQRQEALHMLSWWGKAQAFLQQRTGRWSLLCKGKARQEITDLDLLMRYAGTINDSFLDLVSEIGFNGCSVNRSAGLEFVAGPVKQPTRTLQKLVRRYRRDVGCLTDLVRCTVIADSLENVKDFLQLLYSMSVAGLDNSFGGGDMWGECPPKQEGKGSKQRVGEQVELRDQIFRITALENRFDASYNDETSMGYRDLALNVEVGWLINNGCVSFQKVRDWRRLRCITHICEIQVRTRDIHECAEAGRKEYLILRNGLSQ